MIKRALSESDLPNYPNNSIEAQKIRALQLCYGTKYDFCRFYTAENAVFCGLNGSFVLSVFGECDLEELAGFFAFNGFSEIFCSQDVGERLGNFPECDRRIVNLMRFVGTGVPAETEKNAPLGEIYDILKTGFEIDFEPWYLDMSHRVRHGVSRTRRLGGSALVIQHDIDGNALLSQIATLPEQRGRGGASRLISAVCAELSDSAVFVICEDSLAKFYEKIGFRKEEIKYIIHRS